MNVTQFAFILNSTRQKFGEKFLFRLVAITGDGYFTFEGEFIDFQEGMIILEVDSVLIFAEVDKVSAIEAASLEDEEGEGSGTTTH